VLTVLTTVTAEGFLLEIEMDLQNIVSRESRGQLYQFNDYGYELVVPFPGEETKPSSLQRIEIESGVQLSSYSKCIGVSSLPATWPKH